MNQSATHKNFIFSEKIDSDFLFSLYEDDYAYVAKVFSDTLEELENELMAFAMAFNGGKVAALKNAAHKIKPLFGFTGLMTMQQTVNEFEDHCAAALQVETISKEYELLMEQIDAAREILITEQKRLQDYCTK